MFVYQGSLATPGNLTTNATPNTETETFFVKAGTRNVSLLSATLGGKGSALTAITGLVGRFYKLATASTAGVTITPSPVDPGAQAAKQTSASRSTIGATRTNHHIATMGAAGPGGFVAENPDAMMTNEGSSAGSINMADAAGVASMAFEFSYKTVE